MVSQNLSSSTPSTLPKMLTSRVSDMGRPRQTSPCSPPDISATFMLLHKNLQPNRMRVCASCTTAGLPSCCPALKISSSTSSLTASPPPSRAYGILTRKTPPAPSKSQATSSRQAPLPRRKEPTSWGPSRPKVRPLHRLLWQGPSRDAFTSRIYRAPLWVTIFLRPLRPRMCLPPTWLATPQTYQKQT